MRRGMRDPRLPNGLARELFHRWGFCLTLNGVAGGEGVGRSMLCWPRFCCCDCTSLDLSKEGNPQRVASATLEGACSGPSTAGVPRTRSCEPAWGVSRPRTRRDAPYTQPTPRH